MPDDSRDEFLPENEREGCKKLSHYLRTYVSSRQQSPAVANSRLGYYIVLRQYCSKPY